MEPAPKGVSTRELYVSILQSGGRCWRGERLEDSREIGVRAPSVHRTRDVHPSEAVPVPCSLRALC